MLVDRTFNRRGFLKGALAVGGAAAFQGLNLLDTNGRIEAAPGSGGYGPLGPVKDLRDGVERISLPEGFSYRSFGVGGTPMTRDGLTPLAHDGMAVFNMPNGRFRLVRNHEDRNGATSGNQSVGGDASKKYDGRGGGGTTTLVVNPFTRTLEEDWVSLNGTIVNCAGGATPWGTWITCEETNAGTSSSWLQQHGYCFEVPVTANSTVAAVPLPDMGRFAHEAVAVDPGSKIVYETEDNGDTSGFYRFLANTPGQLINGGRLQMLAIAGQSNYDTRTGETVGVKLPVVWVDIATRTPRARTRRPCSTRALRGAAPASRDSRAAVRRQLDLLQLDQRRQSRAGAVWRYQPSGADKGWLSLVFESPSADVLDFPDNLTVSPQGGILLCEDGDADQYLRGVTPNGQIFDFALNLQNDYEWAGATFADADPSWNAKQFLGDNQPLGGHWDRITLFVNRQGATSGANPPSPGNEGMTFAIWGPWNNGAL